MKKVIKLSEEKLGKIISQIMEQVNLEDYEDEDFIEGFLITFRQWITEKLGDESKKYPLSYLLKKYGSDFEKEMGIHVGYGDSSNFSHYRLLRSGKSLAEKEKYSLTKHLKLSLVILSSSPYIPIKLSITQVPLFCKKSLYSSIIL